VTAHAQVSDVVKENDSGGAFRQGWLAKKRSYHYVRTPRFVNYSAAKGVVLIAKTLLSFRQRATPQVWSTGGHHTGRLSAGVGINDSNFANTTHS
jgi:hypothetical protein